jgi:lipopolysaccharide export LptBFGC system permease protein LptF
MCLTTVCSNTGAQLARWSGKTFLLVVFQGVFGIVVLVAFSHLFRKQHIQPQWHMLLISLAFQIGIAALFLKYEYFCLSP